MKYKPHQKEKTMNGMEILKIKNNYNQTIVHLIENHDLASLLNQDVDQNFPRQLPQNYSFKY